MGDAWNICQSGKADSLKFGYIPGHLQGLWHIATNLVRDIATLNKVETLSWDIWGAQPKRGEQIADNCLEFFDDIAMISSEPDKLFNKLRRIYAEDHRLTVPARVFNSRLGITEKI